MQDLEISAFIKQVLGEESQVIQELKAGRIYLIEVKQQRVILKITNLTWAVDEVFFLQELHKHNISAPNLIGFGMYSDKEGFLILEYIPHCEDHLTNDIRNDMQYWQQFVAGLKSIHAIPVSGFGFNRSNEFARQNFTATTFKQFVRIVLNELRDDLNHSKYEQSVEDLKKYSAALEDYTQAYLAHGDLGGNNFLWEKEKNKLYFVDPSYLRGMPKTWDIAYFGWRTGPDRVTQEDVQKLTSLYFENGLTQYEQFEIAFLRALAGLMKIRDGLRSDEVHDGHVVAMQAHLSDLHLLEE